jgi:hypothetical protein
MWTRIKTGTGRNLAATVAADAVRAGLDGPARITTDVTDDDLAALPPTVQRYLRYMRVVGRPRDRSFTAHFTGRFRLRPDLPWMRYESWQYNNAEPVARISHLRIDVGRVIPLVGRDTYIGGSGLMHGKLLDLVTVAHGDGWQIDLGELTTFLNDAVLLAPSMLLTPATTWTEVDDVSFDVALTDVGRTATARVFVDEGGAPTSFESTDRYAALPEGLVQARWTTPVGAWTLHDARRHLWHASAVWQLDEGPFEYARLRSEPGDVRYGVRPDGTPDGSALPDDVTGEPARRRAGRLLDHLGRTANRRDGGADDDVGPAARPD